MTGGLARKRRRSAKLRLARAMLLGCCGENGGRRNVAQAGLNKTHATIMDMSAKESLQCPNGVPHTRGAGAPACCRRSGSPRAAVVTAILIAFSLSFAGCGIPQAGTTARLIPPPRAGTPGAPELASTPNQPEAPAIPAPPVPQQVPRVNETKPRPAAIGESRPAPATASRGAEKLVALGAPAVVLARERSTIPAEPSVPKAPVAEVSGTVTDAPAQALVFRGPPPEAQPSRVGIRWWVWLGLGLGGAALAVLARLYVIRRAKPPVPAEAGNGKPTPVPGLFFKEPLNLPQAAVMAEKP